MLVLELGPTDSVSLIDTTSGAELGVIKRITPRPSSPNKCLLGFDFPKTIQITRQNLIGGKDNLNEHRQR